MSSKIIPGRATQGGIINNSTINPTSPITGEMNSTKSIEESMIYEGGTTSTAEVIVDNAEAKIYAYVKEVPGTFTVDQADGTVIYFNGSTNQRIKLDAYTIKELTATGTNVKEYGLFKNNDTQVGPNIIIPKDSDLVEALNQEIADRIAVDREIITLLAGKENIATYELRDEDFTEFVFEDNTEISYSEPITHDVTVKIYPETLYQGFISLLTIDSMQEGRIIYINNQDSRYPLRVVCGTEYSTNNSYITSITGKKIIFARCDGLCVEILIIEETPARW